MCALIVSLLRGVGFDAWFVVGKLLRQFVSEAHLELGESERSLLEFFLQIGTISMVDMPEIPHKCEHPSEILSCWILVRPGSRGVTQDMLVDPSSGESIPDSSISHILYMFNENTILEPKETMVTSSRDKEAFTALSFARTERSPSHSLQVSESALRVAFPNGVRTSFHQCAIRTRYSLNLQQDGLTESISRFSDLRRSHLLYIIDVFQGRSDQLVRRLRFGGGSFLEEFEKGRTDRVIRILVDVNRGMRLIEFQEDCRPDGLLKAVTLKEQNNNEWLSFHYGPRRSDLLVRCEYSVSGMTVHFCKPATGRQTNWIDEQCIGFQYNSIAFALTETDDQEPPSVQAVAYSGQIEQLTDKERIRSKILKEKCLQMVESSTKDFEQILRYRDTEEVQLTIQRHPLNENRQPPPPNHTKPNSFTSSLDDDILELLGDEAKLLSPPEVKQKVLERLSSTRCELQKNLTEAQTLFHQNKVRMQAKGTSASEEDRAGFENQQSMVWFRITLIEKRLAQHETYAQSMLSKLNSL